MPLLLFAITLSLPATFCKYPSFTETPTMNVWQIHHHLESADQADLCDVCCQGW